MGTEKIPSRYNWFGNGDSLMLKNKNLLIDFHFGMALAKTLTIFEYEGLPDSVPQRELEKILQLNAFAYWLKKDGELYVFFGGLGGKPNAYYLPSEFIVANPYLQFFKTVKVDKEGVLMWNDYSHMGLYLMLRRYAELMAECDITLRFGLINDRLLSVFYSNNDTVKESIEKFIQDVEDGEKLGVILGESWIDDNNGDFKVNEYRKANSQDLKQIMELQQYLKASFWNDIGIQANYNMKRESINDSEAGMNEESLKPFVDEMLQCRKDALKKVNDQFGTNISVKFASSWIRRNKIPEETPQEQAQQETPQEETPNSEEVNEGKDGNENE